MSTSLRVGLAALGSDVERAMVIMGDQLGVSSGLLDRLLEVHADIPDRAMTHQVPA